MSQVLTVSSEEKRGQSRLHGAGSVYSYSSGAGLAGFVKEIYGRGFNTLNKAYVFPSDRGEWERLDKQQSAFLIAMNGLYPCPELVEAVLAPSESETKRVLDVGCGTGYWATEMAARFPHTEVQGIDLAPAPLDPALVPANLQFSVDDINNGLEHLYGQFDLVHSRCIMTGISDPEKTISELQMCLKPGGLLLIIEGDKELLHEDRTTTVKMARVDGDEDVSGVSEEGSWFERSIWEAHEASKIAGSALERGVEMIDMGLWDQPMCDPETAGACSIYIPIGPWPKSVEFADFPAVKYAGVLMRQNFQKVHRAYHGILLKHGMDQQTLDEWSRKVDEELAAMNPRMWARLRVCWARRRADGNSCAPPLQVASAPIAEPSSTTTLSHPRRYPVVDYYHSREEAALARQKRWATVGEWPTSAVKRAAMASKVTAS